MSYSAFDAHADTPLVDALPSDLAAEWEMRARVDEVLATMRRNYAAVARDFAGLHEVTANQSEALFNIAGGYIEGGEVFFAEVAKGQSPKATMAKVTAGMDQNAKSGRETAQQVAPKNVGKALLYVRSQQEFLSQAGIDIAADLDALSRSNIQFKHVAMEVGASAARVLTETKSMERLIGFMLKNKKNEKSMKKLFGLSFKRLYNMMQAVFD
jgi:hypothetical protein